MIDPIVEEVRAARAEHAKRFNYNLDAIYTDIRQHQFNYRERLVRLKPQKISRSHRPDGGAPAAREKLSEPLIDAD